MSFSAACKVVPFQSVWLFETPRLPNADAGEKVPLWIAGTLQAIAMRGCERAFHINRPVCTGLFPFPVGVVGNLGRFTLFTGRFSKSPHLHSRVLESLALTQAALLKPLHPAFHFSDRKSVV